MIIENQKKVIKVRLRAFIMTVICAILIGIIVTIKLFEKDFLGLDKKTWALGVLAVYIIISLYFIYLNYNYILIKMDPSKILLRHYSLRPWDSAKKSYEIPINELSGVKIKSQLFGIKKGLIFYRKIRKGVAKYPPVSLTGLSKSQIRQINEIFKSFIK